MASGKHIADEIEREIQKAMAPFTEAELKLVGEQAISVIALRTKQGVDADHKPFTPYSDGYKKTREKLGRSSATVDLAVTGHMQQAMESRPDVAEREVNIGFMSAAEETKAAVHNSGVDKQVSVRSHTRSAYIDKKTGRRVSRQEAKRDMKRKVQRVTTRTERVDVFKRNQRTPKREWFDIRHPADTRAVEAVIEDIITNKRK